MRNLNQIFVASEDMRHYTKYLGRGGVGKTRRLADSQSKEENSSFNPSPTDAVKLGIEPLSYLAKFGESSSFFRECQDYLDAAINEIEKALGQHSHLMSIPYASEADIDFNVMLSKVADPVLLTKLGSVSASLRKEMMEVHLKTKEFKESKS